MDQPAPLPMLLWCPECGKRHIDRGPFTTKVHHTHACQYCGMTWRPAVVPTVGVEFLPGFKDSEPELESDAENEALIRLANAVCPIVLSSIDDSDRAIQIDWMPLARFIRGIEQRAEEAAATEIRGGVERNKARDQAFHDIRRLLSRLSNWHWQEQEREYPSNVLDILGDLLIAMYAGVIHLEQP